MAARFWRSRPLACLAAAWATMGNSASPGGGPSTAPPADTPSASAAATDELAGKWRAIEHLYDGKPWPGNNPGEFWVFQGGKFYETTVPTGDTAHLRPEQC